MSIIIMITISTKIILKNYTENNNDNHSRKHGDVNNNSNDYKNYGCNKNDNNENN